jgi:hypothetical protein
LQERVEDVSIFRNLASRRIDDRKPPAAGAPGDGAFAKLVTMQEHQRAPEFLAVEPPAPAEAAASGTQSMWDLVVDPMDEPASPAPSHMGLSAPDAAPPAPLAVAPVAVAPVMTAPVMTAPAMAAPMMAAPAAAAPPAYQPAETDADTPARRAGRVKTRLLGFDHSNGTMAALQARPAAVAEPVQFPVGWLVIVDGPGKGKSFPLGHGVSQIGRGEDQAVSLDFGDTAISREGHAMVAYDDESRGFFLGHGGKSNIVRLNGKPVLSTESVRHGDVLRVGETTLRLVALCGADFDWSGA